MRSDTSSEEIERFGWVRRSNIQEAACLTFVRGNDAGRTAEAFGAIADQVRRFDFDEFCEESFALHETYSVIGIRNIGDWLLVVEDNGHQGSRAEVLRRVSHGTEVTSALWNAQSLTRFSHAVDGEVRTAFEALMPEYRQGTQPDGLEEIRAGLPWSSCGSNGTDSVSLMLALSARITGGPLTPETFDGEFLTFPVAEWPDDLPTTVGVLEEQVAQHHSTAVVEALRWSDGADCRRAATRVAELVLDHVELDHPVISDTLAALRAGQIVDSTAICGAVREWNWQLHVHRATSKVRKQVRATEVLRQATNDDPYLAVLGALHAARLVSGFGTDELVEATMTAQWDA